jgi:hypothetical protein
MPFEGKNTVFLITILSKSKFVFKMGFNRNKNYKKKLKENLVKSEIIILILKFKPVRSKAWIFLFQTNPEYYFMLYKYPFEES